MSRRARASGSSGGPSSASGTPSARCAAAGARRLISDELPADFRAVYRTMELIPEPPAGDLVLLASPSAARAWAKLGPRLPAITIGPQTTEAARLAGLDVVAEAKTQDVAALVDSAAAWRASSRS